MKNDLDKNNDNESLYIGNSKFGDDKWDLSPLITAKTMGRGNKSINFSCLPNKEIRNVVKKYAYYKLGKIKPSTITGFLRITMPVWGEYCKTNGIKSFLDITDDIFISYAIWIKNNKNPALSTGYKYSLFLEEIIRIGQIKGWKVNREVNVKESMANEIWNPKKHRNQNKTKPIQEDIFNVILYHAKNNEKNVLVKAAIIIQSQTGLRISEVLSIKEGCLKISDDGYYYMELMLSKTEKGEPFLHKVYANELVVEMVNELSEYTANLRKDSGLKELFIYKSRGEIKVENAEKWTPYRLKPFIKRWNIRDSKGELYNLNSHQFRATFVKELIKKNVPISFIMKQFAHVSIEMTVHYLSLKDSEVKAIYADMILNPSSKIAGLRASKIKENLDKLFHGKTVEEIDTVISELAETMSFNTLPTGICLYDFRRGNCTDGDGCFFYNCPNYITSTEFYPVLKSELDLLDLEMERLKSLGYERAWQVRFIVWKELNRLVQELGVQMNE